MSKNLEAGARNGEEKEATVLFYSSLLHCNPIPTHAPMPRFRNTVNDPKSCSTPSSKEATKTNGSASGEKSKIAADTIDAAAASNEKNNAKKQPCGNKANDPGDFAIEEDYFSSEFTFDYDTDDASSLAPPAIVWTSTGRYSDGDGANDNDTETDTESNIVKTPKSILRDSSSKSNVNVNPASSQFPTGDSAVRNISFGKDVEFRQKKVTPKKAKPKGSVKKHSGKRQQSPSSSSRRKVSSPVISKSTSESTSVSASTPVPVPKPPRPQNYSAVTQPPPAHSMKRPSTSNAPPSWIPRRGVAIDTRTLQSFAGDAIGNTFHALMHGLLRTCCEEGMLPTILSTTAVKEPKSKTAGRVNQHVVIEARVKTLGHQQAASGSDNDESRTSWDELLIPVPIRPPSNMNNTNDRSVVHAPKRLMASDSWRNFGDLVNAITVESSNDTSTKTPLEITIITNDVALFTDTNIDSHKRAVTRLWDRLREKFDSATISSLHIIVFQTGVDALHPSSSTDSTMEGVEFSASSDPLDIPHRLQVVHVAKTVHGHISDLLLKEYKRKDGDKQGSPMDVSFEMKDLHPIRVRSIVRDWKKGVVASSSCTGSISFDLPETVDGTQCSVKLDLSYSILPYPLISSATEVLIQNLKMMKNAYFEVIQLVPLDTLDLSLVYGVPLVAKAALDGDLEQFREMQKIVRELMTYLQQKDVALALRCINDGKDLLSLSSSHSQHQVFIVMAQTNEEQTGSEQGMIYQYVSAGHHILDQKIQSGSDEVSKEYRDLIGSSLDFLDNKMLNPYEDDTQN